MTCLACGNESQDVALKLVDLEAEARRQGERLATVEVVQEIRHRHITERVKHVVPERYAFEPRCRDRSACDRRIGAGS